MIKKVKYNKTFVALHLIFNLTGFIVSYMAINSGDKFLILVGALMLFISLALPSRD